MTILVRQNTYGAYLDGDATAYEALHALCSDYEELDATYRDFARMREQTRAQISEVLARVDGEKAEIEGFGLLRLMPPSVVKSYDKEKMGALIGALRDQGLDDIADQIIACKVETMRAGSLRIEREK